MSRFRGARSSQPVRMKGKTVPATPEMREATRQRDEQLFNDLLEGTNPLPAGWVHGEVIPPYRQANHRTCFYAALLAIRNAHASRQFDATDEARISREAESRELLSPFGAETDRGHMGQQARFIQLLLRLRVRFIDQSDMSIASELSGALQDEKQVVLGRAAPAGGSGVGHWVGLDGVSKQASGGIGFTGMDTASGNRIEYPAETVHQDLLKFALPLVVVEAYEPRFQPAHSSAPIRSRFRPAGS